MQDDLAPEINDVELESDADEAILRVMRERFEVAVEAEREIREDAKDDLEFSAGKQWDERDLASRKANGRPSLTINRMPQSIRQVANDIRQNPVSMNVSPVDDKADVDTAKHLKGMIRHIEYASDADTAYETAGESAIRCGYGFFRIASQYADPMSFDQELRILPVADRFSVRMDPAFRLPDGSDSNWAFVEESLSIEEYNALYPDQEINTHDLDFKTMQTRAGDWLDEKNVRVAEYFYREWTKKEISLLSNGDVVPNDELPDEEELALSGLYVAGTRTTLIPKVQWIKTNGVAILDRKEWPGRWIPIIPVLGEQILIDGKRTLAGLIRHAKDSQRMYNYFASCEAEAIALAPKAPWIGYAGQFDGFEDEWSTANTKNHAYLEVNPVMINNQAAPLPQRNAFEPAIQSISNGRMLAAEDVKATTGLYDAALGAGGQEKSGIAIQRRTSQSQTSNFHFADNLAKSVRHGARQLVELIPIIYDTPRAVRTLGEDGSEEVIKINQLFDKDGKEKTIDLSIGKYDVTVSTGPSYETKRQESTSSMLELARTMPNFMQSGADIIVKNMDFPGADEVAKRLTKMIDPKLKEEEGEGQNALPPQAKAQMDQQAQMIAQLSQELEARTKQMSEKTLEFEHKERVVAMQLETQVRMKLADLQSKEAIETFKLEVGNMRESATAGLEQQAYELDQASQFRSQPIQNQVPQPSQEMSFGPGQGQEPSFEMEDPQQFTGELPPASMETP